MRKYNPIPPELREKLQRQERMYRCVVADGDCEGRTEWHHAVIYGGSKLQVDWAIHGICHYHHVIADRKDIREKIVSAMRRLGGKSVENYEKIKKL